MHKIAFIVFLLIYTPMPAYAQEATEAEKKESTEEEQGFINYGLLSISIGHKLTKDGKHIIYKINNNTGQSIDSIFGWIYKIRRSADENVPKVVLVNNPNISGILISKLPHKPFTLGTWRFTLRRKSPPENVDYVLRVNDRSIFYVPFEFQEPLTTSLPEEEEGAPSE